jgi:hypothetical protein
VSNTFVATRTVDLHSGKTLLVCTLLSHSLRASGTIYYYRMMDLVATILDDDDDDDDG